MADTGMTDGLSLTTSILGKADSALPGFPIMPFHFCLRRVFVTTNLAFEDLAAGCGFAIFHLIFSSLKVWTSNHASIIHAFVFGHCLTVHTGRVIFSFAH